MTNEVYSKQAVDTFFQGVFEVLGHTVSLVMEQRIDDALNDRAAGAKLFDDLAAATSNAAARGFYEAMAHRTRNPADLAPLPTLTVIDGGLTD